MAIDNKYGRVTTELGTIGEKEPVVVFRAQDKLLVPVLDYYLELCRVAGSHKNHMDLITQTRDQVRDWQEKNHTQVPTSN